MQISITFYNLLLLEPFMEDIYVFYYITMDYSSIIEEIRNQLKYL
jgi:hypothetical protein